MTSPLPERMLAIEISEPGGPEVLHLCHRVRPEPGPGEVLIEVAAAGINRPDLLQRQGRYPPPAGASDIPGLEIAGRVVACAADVSQPRPGDAVCALVSGGGYAQYCTAPAALCLPVPAGLTLLEAATLPETFFTVWANLFQQGSLKAGDRVLIHGGSGGIGTTAIQLARAFGAQVFATAGGPDACAFCAGLGATAIDYRSEAFDERIRAATGGQGVDIILDIIGAPYWQRNLDCLARSGRLLLIAVQGGSRAETNLLPILLKHLRIAGSTLRPRSVAEKAEIAAALLAEVWPLLATGRIRPIVHAVFSLSQAADAHRRLEAGGHHGKLVLRLDPLA